MNKYAEEQLRCAIKIMRDACDEAEEYVNMEGALDHRRVTNVIHSLQWGMANSTFHIESTIRAIMEQQTALIEGLKDTGLLDAALAMRALGTCEGW